MTIGDLVTLSNGKEYIVVKTITLNGNDYVFLITKDGISEVIICMLQNDVLKIVKDENTYSILLQKFKKE